MIANHKNTTNTDGASICLFIMHLRMVSWNATYLILTGISFFFSWENNKRCPNFRLKVKRWAASVPTWLPQRTAPWRTGWVQAEAARRQQVDVVRPRRSNRRKATWRPWSRISSTRKVALVATAQHPCWTGSITIRAVILQCPARVPPHRWLSPPARPAPPSSLATRIRRNSKSFRPHRRPPAVHVSNALLRLVLQHAFVLAIAHRTCNFVLFCLPKILSSSQPD